MKMLSGIIKKNSAYFHKQALHELKIEMTKLKRKISQLSQNNKSSLPL